MIVRSFEGNRHLTGLMQTDGTRSGRRQIDMPAPHERAAIVDAHDHASAVTNTNARSKRQGAMGCGHCRAIEAFSVGGAAAAQAGATAINACYFGTHELAAAEQQQRGAYKELQIPIEQSAHVATSPFRAFNKKDFDDIPKRSQSMQIAIE